MWGDQKSSQASSSIAFHVIAIIITALVTLTPGLPLNLKLNDFSRLARQITRDPLVSLVLWLQMHAAMPTCHAPSKSLPLHPRS